MIYLRKFDNHAAYEAAESSLILPNVSLCVNENEVHYNPSTPPTPQHDYVEIGGVKWATMNIGANSVTDAGLYFQWGDTQGYTASQVGADKTFNWVSYKYGNGTASPGNTGMTKYNSTDSKTTLDSSDDAAVANWGGAWRLPTSGEMQSLIDNTTNEWVTDYQSSGVSGILFTDKNDNSKALFFPATGYCNGGSVGGANYVGFCWSSLLSTSTMTNGMLFYFHPGSCSISSGSRADGYPVRGILDE